MTNIERAAGVGQGNDIENDSLTRCHDCLFWYRCKLGRIDCELKER